MDSEYKHCEQNKTITIHEQIGQKTLILEYAKTMWN